MGDVHSGDRRYTLEELGIVRLHNAYGEEQLSIYLPPNDIFGLGQGQAVFNSNTQKWELTSTTGLKLGRKPDTVWKQKSLTTKPTNLSTRPVKWTRCLPKNEHVDTFLNAIDWKNTPLGILETWPPSLQTYLDIVFTDGQAAAIYWGDELCAIYNAETARILAGRLNMPHDLLGVPFAKMWPELWNDFAPIFDSISTKGTGMEALEVNLFPETNGILEETFWQGSFLPIRDNDCRIRGFYNRVRETTKNVINERRSKVFSALVAKPKITGDFIFKHLISSLSLSERDFPFAFIYSADEDVAAGRCHLKFQYGEGIPLGGHPLIPEETELHEGHIGFVPFFRTAKSRAEALILHTADRTLPPHMLEGFQWRGFGDAPRSIAILPLSTNERLLAILVFGLNPRRPYDDEYDDFVNVLIRLASATVASAIGHEKAQNRTERLAKQIEDNERSVREIAEYGPVGIARIALSGKLVWGNDQFYEITGHSRAEEDHYEMSFMEVVHPEDQKLASDLWSTMRGTQRTVSSPLRLKRTWKPPPNRGSSSEDAQPVWVLLSSFPIKRDGDLKAFAVSVTDISQFKWAERIQSESATAAKEAKRLQENFIDIISHEMRNPLSAITQLADGISTSLADFEATGKRGEDARDILSNNVESSRTILLCAAHQKRIIDDVLTLSKLDSMLLSITPVVVQPYKIVEDVLKMFEGEFTANEIKVESETAPSYDEHKVDWVALDPSRLTQIFINLITNAVKFTKLEAHRKITIRVGANNTRPPSLAGVKWFPTNKKYPDLTAGPEWGDGAAIYICFEVRDTGRGLEQSEMTKLFGRFQQATEKTHIKYGGSGLGLFISRELTETQGGEIGVLSQRGKGTTFAFYVKSRRAEAPDDSALMPQPAQPHKSATDALRRTASSNAEKGIQERLRVLLVEDNVINAKVLTKQLEKAECEVHVANHGMEALDFLRKTKAWEGIQDEQDATDIDVCLMDVEMPIMDGLTCTRRIRQLEGEGKLRRHISIVATTANARQEQIDKVIQAGADDVLPKPFKVKECLDKMREVLARTAHGSNVQRPRTGQ
ncbi:hypothetical protein H2198_008876 [Neophaeococcomyces mojaviensis]|uniref:Uncharacterized protein n=1 Tax=Neophaeococcomyces mojaviensis TaxID=3383035 RepID=A0ACC2ZW98_9EURO|nr:hypothetical protein H2198_008876 [Knufia sp. JES_112]